MRPRTVAATVALAALGAVIGSSIADLEPFGTPSGAANAFVRVVEHERHSANAVNGITYDLRGLDTLGEELILFLAALGSAVLLRHGRGEKLDAAAEDEARPRTAGLLRVAGALLVGPVIVFGAYIVAHGHLGPGGGFQGGVLLAGALLLVYVAGQLIGLERVEPIALVEVADAAGALAYALVAVGGLVFASAALFNFIPQGTTGQMFSAGTIPVLSVAVGVEVTGAVALILTELLDQALLRSDK